MTELEYRRWKAFSIRMAHRGFQLRLRKSRKILAGFVKDFFRTLDRDYFQINKILPVDWDSEEFLRDRIVSWDHTDDHPTWRDNSGHSTCGPFICDVVSTQMENWVMGPEPLIEDSFIGVIPGVGLIPGESRPTVTFAEIPDNAGVWL